MHNNIRREFLLHDVNHVGRELSIFTHNAHQSVANHENGVITSVAVAYDATRVSPLEFLSSRWFSNFQLTAEFLFFVRSLTIEFASHFNEQEENR